ncbi:hypothetical protein P175DRAFT_0529039 [Aspergillus ochraceoroseus IBT 24754]|uniref:Uncharacterized protein n=1 Tax=Aspergillus ochraceoroseus IBT 24754 TaxID=1392256 RepID=A0A2T5MAD0_9EURO|nr:uncharacterized protein P175DRAFT_0529039 [Aspergillus ochraceoroseus IBT 24754]PTU25486.1 hypothetical protein P175DRAFT_0529039 [Aspergillus ochraceoroseus IBT 24754]
MVAQSIREEEHKRELKDASQKKWTMIAREHYYVGLLVIPGSGFFGRYFRADAGFGGSSCQMHTPRHEKRGKSWWSARKRDSVRGEQDENHCD